MRDLTDSELLTLWEQARLQPNHRRALMLLKAAYPDRKAEDLASLSVGRRDALLLALRERLFGLGLEGITDCPSCGEKLDLGFTVSDIRINTTPRQPSRMSLEMDGYEVVFRLPDSNDLALLVLDDGLEAGRKTLLDRCLLAVRVKGKEQPFRTLPQEIISALCERMSQADPQAEIELQLDCPTCSHRWVALFDILPFLWSEIESRVRRIFCEIHLLARSYGWREADILAMSPLRRQTYMEMLTA